MYINKKCHKVCRHFSQPRELFLKKKTLNIAQPQKYFYKTNFLLKLCLCRMTKSYSYNLFQFKTFLSIRLFLEKIKWKKLHVTSK